MKDPPSPPAPQKNTFVRVEVVVACLLVFAMVAVPVLSSLSRSSPPWLPLPRFPSAPAYMSHLLLFIALIAGLCVNRARRNININLIDLGDGKWHRMLQATRELWAFLSLTLLFCSTLAFFTSLNLDNHEVIAYLPQWLWMSPLVLTTGLLLLFQGKRVVDLTGPWPLILALLVSLFLSQAPLLRFLEQLSTLFPQAGTGEIISSLNIRLDALLQPLWIPAVVVTILLSLAGLPIYISLASLALFSFLHSEGFPEIVINDFYTLFTENVLLQSLPLFALAGFILSEGRSAQRLVDFLDLLLGHVRGGVAIMAILLSAFFTAITGASGVTILALGGLFVQILRKSGYSRPFTLGLLTSCGSIGLLFPPSLPIIMYSVGAGVSIKNMFLAGLLPGSLLILVTIGMALHHARKPSPNRSHPRPDFQWSTFVRHFRAAAGEILLPILLVVGIFFLQITMVELSAFAVLYCLALALLHRDYNWSSFGSMIINYLEVLGGILIVIGFARGLADYLALQDVPGWLAQVVETSIHNKWLFLLLLNLLLLLTGAIMDIYSAIIIVAPLVVAMAARYQLAPEQLGIIFLANLELGYMTPPVGMSLFLARYRFDEPIIKLYRHVLPFLLLMLAAVLLITYFPWFSQALLPAN